MLFKPGGNGVGHFACRLGPGVGVFLKHPEIEVDDCRVEIRRGLFQFIERVRRRLVPVGLDPLHDAALCKRRTANEQVVERAAKRIDV